MYHPGKKGQRYFTMPRHSQRKISFYEGNDIGVRYFLFHSLSSVSNTSSVLSNSKATDSRTCKYKKFRFNDSSDRRKELQWLVDNLQLIKRKTSINSQPQITISTHASYEGWGHLLSRSKDKGTSDISGKERSYVLELRALKYAILAFSRLHPNAQSIHIQTDSMVALLYFVKMGRIETNL